MNTGNFHKLHTLYSEKSSEEQQKEYQCELRQKSFLSCICREPVKASSELVTEEQGKVTRIYSGIQESSI